MWQGDKKYLPGSQLQGEILAQKIVAPMRAQIAVFFGDRSGSLESLQHGAIKLASGKPIICDECKRAIWQEKHTADCPIAIEYDDVMNKPAGMPAWLSRKPKDD